ncbi:MAG: carboxymuconolactone decarboxylase family protein, partial [Paracoccus sp. (in: a-proteobacteria)]|uniref:carboxymuconolactone decarboxylase family protein n=1 Tax=Paracoccus sp. TaxID=267 RepID=UPI0026DEEADA
MTPRLEYYKAAPDVMKAMLTLEASLKNLSISAALRELIKMRVSQINGCAYCLDMHAPEARKVGISQQKLDVLAAWRESPAFDARERAALGWAESLTRIEATGAPRADYDLLAEAFSPQ